MAIDKQVDGISVNICNLALKNDRPDHVKVLQFAWVVHDEEIWFVLVFVLLVILFLLFVRLVPQRVKVAPSRLLLLLGLLGLALPQY